MYKLFSCLILQAIAAASINAQQIMPGDIVINEILFNPVKDGYDYVELYNRSNTPINIGELLIANRNPADEIASVKNISRDSLIITPAGYFIITANQKWLKQHYIVPDSALIIQLSSLPSLPDDDGCVLLLRKSDSVIIDELKYDKKWHSRLIADPEGVALERLHYALPTGDKNNWTSASSSSGWGTPGYVNSQFKNDEMGYAGISVSPEIFSPDNDGQSDFAVISIKAEDQGKIANGVIFNAMGRSVRYLLRNEILGINNRFIWDGYDDRDQLLPSGIYILVTQIFDTKGRVRKYRHCIVLDSFPP